MSGSVNEKPFFWDATVRKMMFSTVKKITDAIWKVSNRGRNLLRRSEKFLFSGMTAREKAGSIHFIHQSFPTLFEIEDVEVYDAFVFKAVDFKEGARCYFAYLGAVAVSHDLFE